MHVYVDEDAVLVGTFHEATYLINKSMNMVATFLSYYMMLVPRCSQILAFRCNLHLNLPTHAPTSNVEKLSVVSALRAFSYIITQATRHSPQTPRALKSTEYWKKLRTEYLADDRSLIKFDFAIAIVNHLKYVYCR